jgi:uncharacterized protein (DUF1778 family)
MEKHPRRSPRVEPASARSGTINVRVRPQQRALIDRAATAQRKNRTDFILDAACREAETVLLDRRYFSLDDAAFRRFSRALDAPPADNPRLRKLMRTKPPWEA